MPVRQKRPFEAISRARALLASSRARLDRTEATLSHTKSGDARERRSVEQEIAASVRRAFGGGPSAAGVHCGRAERARRAARQVREAAQPKDVEPSTAQPKATDLTTAQPKGGGPAEPPAPALDEGA
ncbi:hypothetical protein [Streptomyces chrestomyceticus]|uniref:hypothetical protein n=1 Tax=Streptomyces chrestomyceticus TaxID=68185 RepID=UPI003402AB18